MKFWSIAWLTWLVATIALVAVVILFSIPVIPSFFLGLVVGWAGMTGGLTLAEKITGESW